MPATRTFSLGRDTSLVVISPLGTELSIPYVTQFDAKQETHRVTIRPLNGPPQAVDIPDGWNISIHVERASSAVDDLFAAIELGYWAGGIIGTGEVYVYISEPDGSTSTWLYSGVTMKLTDAGTFKIDSAVTQTIDAYAVSRKRV